MAKEVKALPFEVKIDADKRTLTGYASTFGNKDLVGDIVQPGAFAKTISERGPNPNRNGDIKVLWQHWDPIGRPLHLEEDSKGLYVEAYISNTTLGNDALALAQDGVIDKFSIGYDVIQDEYDPNTSSRLLKELKLYEFSLVTFPANESANVTGMKNYDQLRDLLQKTNSLDVNRLLKAGKVLSNANRSLIENAIEALNSVLSLAEPPEDDDDTKGTQNAGKPLHLDVLDGIEAKELADILKEFKTFN